MPRPQLSQAEMEQFRSTASTAALELLEEEGIPNLTLRRLAKRLGCSYAKPYTYYRDKEHLLDAVRGRAFDRLAEFMTAAQRETRKTQGLAYLRFAFENPEAYRIMFELRQDHTSEETRASEARAWEICARPIHVAVEDGELEGDPETIAHIAWATLHGLATLALANKLHHGKSLEEIAAALHAVLDGFRPGARS